MKCHPSFRTEPVRFLSDAGIGSIPRRIASASAWKNTAAKKNTAGSTAASATSWYEICAISAIKNAAAPITGGIS